MKKLLLVLPLCFIAMSYSNLLAQCAGESFYLTMNTDNYPGETTWTIESSTGTVVASGGPYANANSLYIDTICVPLDSCYTYTINDSYGDGICCGYGNGSYSLENSTGTVVASGGSFGTTEVSAQFCTGGCSNSANYTYSSTGLTTTFTDASTSSLGIFAWSWDFGDGNTSFQQNPTHTYVTDGAYITCLTIYDSCNTTTFCDTVYVSSSCNGPTAGFTNTPNNLSVDFTDNTASTAGGLVWSWDFGDGNTSFQQNPTHTYAVGGTYTVCLIAMDSCANDTTCSMITVSDPCPTAANFGASTMDLTANFTDASSVGVFSWSWDFGDGNTSFQQNPSHTYATAGSYVVCLTVFDSCTTDTYCETITVVDPCTGPSAAFTFAATDLDVAFTDASTSSTGILSWAWDFGDGNTATMQSPNHTYAAAGNYTVCLTVMDSCGSSTICDSTINVTTSGLGSLDELSIKIYPNPAQDIVNVVSEIEINAIEVINAAGQVVLKDSKIGVTNYQFDGSAFAKGTYSVKVITSKGVSIKTIAFE